MSLSGHTNDQHRNTLQLNKTWKRLTPLRLQWGTQIKQTLHDVLIQPELDPLSVITESVASKVPKADQEYVRALAIEELKRVHMGVLARYGVKPSEFERWCAVHRTDK